MQGHCELLLLGTYEKTVNFDYSAKYNAKTTMENYELPCVKNTFMLIKL